MSTSQHSFRRIKLFLSSTFRDMNTERDYLVTYIFPRIHQYCATRFLEFIPIDLRWGIPEEESRNGLVLTTCLEEVDNSRPFFIGLLGSRYGWMPTESELTGLRPSVEDQRPWLNAKVAESASITEIEIEYGVLRDMDIPHACFFIRSAEMEVPDEFKEATGSVAEYRLSLLKKKIRTQNKYPVYDYSSPEQLGETLMNKIIAMIETEYPADTVNAADVLKGRHEFTLKRRSDTLCEISETRRNFDKWIEDGNQLLLLKGPSGSGTSTGLAYSVVDLRRTYPNNKIIYYDFEIADPGQDPVDAFLGFLSLEQCRLSKDEWSMIAVDNSSQLDASEVERIMEWIDSLPSNIHVAFAAASTSPLITILQYRYACPSITFHGLTLQMQPEFINNFTRRFGKRLTEKQIKAITAGRHSNDPTVLKVLLNSLVNFGSIEQLDDRIAKLVDSSSFSIFSGLLYEGRDTFHKIGLLREFAEATVAISLMPIGISESDLLNATGMSQAKWSVIRPYIIQFCKGNNDRLTFVESSWNQDVKNCWGTPFRAAIGIKLIDWYLADPVRLARAAKAVASIYSDIWHLPMEDDDLKKLNEKVFSIALSPSTVSVLNNTYLSTLWKLLSSQSMQEIPQFYIGRPLPALLPQEVIKHYLRLAHIASSQCRGADAAFCYERIAELKTGLNHQDAPLYHAMACLEIGQASRALEIIDTSRLAVTKRTLFARLSFQKSDVHIAPHTRLKAILLRSKTFLLKGDWFTFFKTMMQFIDLAEEIGENTSPAEIETCAEGTVMVCYVLSCYSTAIEDHKQAIEFSQMISEYVERLGVGHPLSYLFMMAKTFRLFRAGNFNEMLNAAYWTEQSACMAFGRESYQYGRAHILYTYAHFKLHGDHGDPHQARNIYNPRNYIRSFETFRNNNIDWQSVDLDVRQEILRECNLFRKLIRDVQPLPEQQRMDSECDTLRQHFGL